jgi:hypothetical protein
LLDFTFLSEIISYFITKIQHLLFQANSDLLRFSKSAFSLVS